MYTASLIMLTAFSASFVSLCVIALVEAALAATDDAERHSGPMGRMVRGCVWEARRVNRE